MYTCTHTHTHAHTYTHTNTHTHARIYLYTHAYTYRDTLVHVYTETETYSYQLSFRCSRGTTRWNRNRESDRIQSSTERRLQPITVSHLVTEILLNALQQPKALL